MDSYGLLIILAIVGATFIAISSTIGIIAIYQLSRMGFKELRSAWRSGAVNIWSTDREEDRRER